MECDSIVGAVSIEKLDDSILISKLVVDPTFFRRGVAKALIAHCLQSYPKQHFQVGTGADNQPALRLYQSLGFKIFATEAIEHNLNIIRLRREWAE
jgi:ribosomal protein S18 acetylase RimI-like enzyme